MHTIQLSAGPLGGHVWTVETEPVIDNVITIGSHRYRVTHSASTDVAGTTLTTWFATYTGEVA